MTFSQNNRVPAEPSFYNGLGGKQLEKLCILMLLFKHFVNCCPRQGLNVKIVFIFYTYDSGQCPVLHTICLTMPCLPRKWPLMFSKQNIPPLYVAELSSKRILTSIENPVMSSMIQSLGDWVLHPHLVPLQLTVSSRFRSPVSVLSPSSGLSVCLVLQPVRCDLSIPVGCRSKDLLFWSRPERLLREEGADLK